MPVEAGQNLSHYRLIEKIGEGGMGVVWKAEDTVLGRTVAIKVLPADVSRDAKRREMFLKEARLASSVSAAHVAQVYEFAREADLDFIVMEFVDGSPLSKLLGGCPLPPHKVVDLARQIANALSKAHRNRLLHRDLKPGNVMVTPDGEVKVLDFGLATLFERSDTLSPSQVTTRLGDEEIDAGKLAGTLPYMSPEQARMERLDARSDIFSLGTVLYEMTTGHLPFTGPTAGLILQAVQAARPKPAHDIVPQVPLELDRIIQKAMAPRRGDRYQDVEDLAVDLKRLGRELDSGSSPSYEDLARTSEQPPRKVAHAAVTSAALVVLIVGLGLWWRWSAEPPHLTTAETIESIAVIPFESVTPEKGMDYLRLAIPDEITTLLTYAPSLTVRPFSLIKRQLGSASDPLAFGRAVEATTVLAGHYSMEGAYLKITMEAINVESAGVVWRGSFRIPQNDLVQLQREIADSVHNGLLKKIGVQLPVGGADTQPTDEQAYKAFLRSLASADDPVPNEHAIEVLESAVTRDADYAPAWSELFRRYYFSSHFGSGGPKAMRRAEEALDRALSLDSNLPAAVGQRIRLRVERAELDVALEEARAFVAGRRADSVAHFTLAYALRFAGALKESCRECDIALALDPTNPTFRTCSLPFAILGDYERAKDFVSLDPGGEWAIEARALILMRQGKTEEAVTEWQRLPSNSPRTKKRALIEACLQHDNPSAIDAAANDLMNDELSRQDPERKFRAAALLAVCGRHADALRFLRLAVNDRYCSYPAMDLDPLFESVRGEPGFSTVRDAAIQCRQSVLHESN